MDIAVKKTNVHQVKVRHRPQLLSDNGPCFLANDLKTYLDNMDIKHIRGAPFHPQTQGKIERYHRSLKNVINLDNYYYPWELEKVIAEFVEYYNNERYHESINNLTPADVFFGRGEQILSARQVVKEQTLNQRRYQNVKIKKTKNGVELAEYLS